jgi:hypothetical protein
MIHIFPSFIISMSKVIHMKRISGIDEIYVLFEHIYMRIYFTKYGRENLLRFDFSSKV